MKKNIKHRVSKRGNSKKRRGRRGRRARRKK